MNGSAGVTIRNGQALKLADLPHLSTTAFLAAIWERTRGGERISALFGTPAAKGDGTQTRLYAVLADDQHGTLAALTTLVGDRYPSLTPDCPQAHWFEREIAEQWGIIPEGHPWLKPIRFHHSYRPGHNLWGRQPGEFIPCSVTDYFKMSGEEAHEVAVGPIHAGIIEPGSFRFQCHGETVYHLEISLGYQHRGI